MLFSRQKKQRDWLRLDNAAKIYPATRTNKWSAVFRIAVILREDVEPGLLQQSLRAAVGRFPSFYLQLRRGIFWYYLDKPPAGFVVRPVPETEPPCRPIHDEEGVGFRLLYHKRRIALECFHILSDGGGALEFFKAIVADYLARAGKTSGPLDGIPSLNEDPYPREWEDGFQRHADRLARGKRTESKAWQITGQPLQNLMVINGLLPIAPLKAAARELGVSITEYIAGHLFCILWEHRTDDRPVKVSIPVDLRRYLPTQTLRNFSSYINITADKEPNSLQEACLLVKEQLRSQATTDLLRHKMSLNVNAERNVLLRILPLPLKDIGLKIAFALYGESLYSVNFTNLGHLSLPKEIEAQIERFECMLGEPRLNALALAAVGFGDTVTLTVTRRIRESWIDRALFARLAAAGLPVSIIANQEVKHPEM